MSTDTEELDISVENSTLDSDKSEVVETSQESIESSEASEDELYFWSEPGVCG